MEEFFGGIWTDFARDLFLFLECFFFFFFYYVSCEQTGLVILLKGVGGFGGFRAFGLVLGYTMFCDV